ncbi:MAG: acyl--CoA ligase [Devosia nanyangense]|uniref:Acyl--CoA ligase n=1 Tax=Devosia nanyangense TaxID=1228055 RepID=A0A933L1R4_9HYPH|nr:acyl--CoA ligase [Devosia nanyangense]
MAANELTVAAAFRRVVHWRGDHEAAIDSRTRLTYRELDDLSDRCAALLRARGVPQGAPVALLLPASCIYLVAWLGAIKAGAVPMALHLRESTKQLAEICRNIGPAALVYDATMEDAAREIEAACRSITAVVRAVTALSQEHPSPVHAVPTIPDDLLQYAAGALPIETVETDPAIIVLSSGTTSVPKGVVHTHRSLLELARTDVYLYGGLRPSDRTLVPLSPAFIGGYNGWYPFLNAGGCVVFMERFGIEALAEKLTRERITHLFLTPTLWRRLLKVDLPGADFSALRQIGSGAEIMDAETLTGLRERLCPNVVQVYGSTETGAGGTCIFADEMTDGRLVSVGRPMVNGDLRIVRPGGSPAEELPPGEVGEILLTGPSLAAGIWGNPELTASLFSEHDGQRWWRSRDLGRIDADGYLFVEGRSSDMIISGGINIMPAPIEEVLLAHPGVAECAVVGVVHPEWGERVEAFIVRTTVHLAADDLDRHVLNSDLSPYQRPRLYRFVDELPRTPTNKINRTTLRHLASLDPQPN